MIQLQIVANCIVAIIDDLTTTAGLETDGDANLIDRHSLCAEADDLGITLVDLLKVCQHLDLNLFHGRFGLQCIQDLILYGRSCGVFGIEAFAFVLKIQRQDVYTVRIAALQKSLMRAVLAASGIRTKSLGAIRIGEYTATFTAHLEILIDIIPEVLHVRSEVLFRNGHEAKLICEFSQSHGGEVVLDVIGLFKVESILSERHQYLTCLHRLSIKALSVGVLIS